MEKRLITGISYSKNDVRITLTAMPDHPGLSSAIFGALSQKEVNVDMIVQNISTDGKSVDITFTIPKEELERGKAAIESVQNIVQYQEIKIDNNIRNLQMQQNIGLNYYSAYKRTAMALIEYFIYFYSIYLNKIKEFNVKNFEMNIKKKP
jgi:aspartokinase